jgi:hypothetical protein
VLNRKKHLPLYKGPASESFGRVLPKSAKNYFWDVQISKVLELIAMTEVNLTPSTSNPFDFPKFGLTAREYPGAPGQALEPQRAQRSEERKIQLAFSSDLGALCGFAVN